LNKIRQRILDALPIRLRFALRYIRQRILDAPPIRLRFALRYMKIHRRFSLLLFPTLFTEKLMLRIAIDRRDILRQMADKLEMRCYVENKVGKRYLPRLYCVTKDPRSIAFDTLPSKFVVKANHGSHFVRVVTDKKTIDVQSLVSECQGWLNIDYGQCYGEWGYLGLKRCLMVEEFVESSYKDKQGIPADFRFLVFDGQCALISVDIGWPPSARRNLYYPPWEPVPVTCIELAPGYSPIEGRLEPPADLRAMIALAEDLARGIDFVRVDLYSTPCGPLVGELTMTPGAGMRRFPERKFDRLLGKKWNLPKEFSERPRAAFHST
jgi:hypothetical protein